MYKYRLGIGAQAYLRCIYVCYVGIALRADAMAIIWPFSSHRFIPAETASLQFVFAVYLMSDRANSCSCELNGSWTERKVIPTCLHSSLGFPLELQLVGQNRASNRAAIVPAPSHHHQSHFGYSPLRTELELPRDWSDDHASSLPPQNRGCLVSIGAFNVRGSVLDVGAVDYDISFHDQSLQWTLVSLQLYIPSIPPALLRFTCNSVMLQWLHIPKRFKARLFRIIE